MPATEEQALAAAEVVFDGVVAARPRDLLGQPQDGLIRATVTFAVENAIKGGPLPERIQIETDGTNSSCAVGFAVGQRWRVYAATWDGGPLATGGCSNNQLLAEGAEIPPMRATGDEGHSHTGLPRELLLAFGAAGLLAIASVVAFRRDSAGGRSLGRTR